jgi:hypothetical protein
MLSSVWGAQSQQEQCCQSSSVKDISSFEMALDAFIANNTLAPWDVFFNANLPTTFKTDCGEVCHGAVNDIAISSMFILMLLTSIGGLRITGGINEARFYYEEFMIKSKTGYVMPDSWKIMTLTGIGTNEGMFRILNKIYRPGTCV